jgi:hypothetical protein
LLEAISSSNYFYAGIEDIFHLFNKITMGRACSTMGERKHEYRALMGKPEERRPLVIPRNRWEDNIKMDFRELERGMDWIGVVQVTELL